ncbi:MAG: tetratricopeptide repeat protein, partial [Chloroflexi bacterium]|nr:tetratricopeptide repeat protein [Chloroflexota bacterium]
VLQFAAISLGTFLLINLPFIIWDFRDWALGVFEPVYAAFNVYSHGLGSLSQFGLLPLPRHFYTGLQIAAFAIMLIVHWRHPRSVGQAFWIFPGIFFWLYYRGLFNYWIYWIPPLLMAMMRYRREKASTLDERAQEAARWRRTIDLAMPLVLANVLWGIVLLQRRPLVTATTFYPHVRLANASDRAMFPRFAVQRDPGLQPLPLRIVSGPESLKPGEAGQYVVEAGTFRPGEGGQIVITDAGGDYELRAVLTIPADPTSDNTDRIVNPTFGRWTAEATAPSDWRMQATAGSSATAEIRTVEGRAALAIHLRNGSPRSDLAAVWLTQTVTFPDTFAVWVYPTAASTDPHDTAYGIELYDGTHRLWILFGDSDSQGNLAPDYYFVTLRSPQRAWSRQTVEVGQLYERLGWRLPAFILRNRNGLEFAARQVQLSLLVASRSKESLEVFGPLEQDETWAQPDALVSDAISHPDIYYVNRGDEYRRQRNYDLAVDAYRRALSYNTDNADAYNGLGWAVFQERGCAEAIAYFEAARALDPDAAGPRQGPETCDR